MAEDGGPDGPGQEPLLEVWLNRATDPSMPEENWECIQRFCDRVNTDPKGPSLAPLLLAHKIQSPQEREALHALTVLETCINHCGERFHDEVAKFRFLNELIKVLSPKYLGAWSTEKVKKRVTEIMFSWTVWFPEEVKIRDAYQMLKKQGIIKQDPKLPEDKILPPPSPRPKSTIFDSDEEKSKLLAKLLKSSHADDLEAANRLIKSMIKEDQEKCEKVSRRASAIDEVHSTVNQLKEMLSSYRRQDLTQPNQEILRGLYERCEKLRPTLFRLASDTVDDDDALAEILKANDQLTQGVLLYKEVVEGQKSNGSRNSDDAAGAPGCSRSSQDSRDSRDSRGTIKSYTLIDFSELDSGSVGEPTAPAGSDSGLSSLCLLKEELAVLGLNSPPASLQTAPQFGDTKVTGQNGWKELSSTPSQIPPGPCRARMTNGSVGSRSPEKNVPLGLGEPQVSPQGQSFPWNLLPLKVPSQDPLPAPPQEASLPDRPWETKSSGAPSQLESLDASLAQLFVPLGSIKPSRLPPITVYDRNGLKAMLHFSLAEAAPGHPEVQALVLSMLSTAPQPVGDIVFQAAVPKAMRVKLQPASSSKLPPFSPFLPPVVISQVLLLANPHKEPVRLRYKLTFTQGGQPFSEVGEVNTFPEPELWGTI
ncbi:ADP-ribosylation factor-binding protein GGA2 [Ornithorhynchus anatinus]|uniref:Golgi associated, gamma adaptin ear containing, ARF binding protein 2 n=1 Tax=Ornithorhynchus anatinus TaxID=9258 RepID=F7FWM4_ORNAN|nr:ADP-ribosylation factor-binding protein GGA2 [Ornithorhynchus anatinus]